MPRTLPRRSTSTAMTMASRPACCGRAQLDGAHPLRTWRQHCRLTIQALATATGLSKPRIGRIASGERVDTAAALKKLAKAVRVPLAQRQP